MVEIKDNAKKNIYIKKNLNKFSNFFGIKQTKLAKPGEKSFISVQNETQSNTLPV